MRLRGQLTLLVVTTVVTTALIAVAIADYALRNAVEANLEDRSTVIAEALTASRDVRGAAELVATGVAPSLEPSIANARSLLTQLVASDAELDYLYLGVWNAEGDIVDVAWEPVDARANGFALVEDAERKRFVERASRGRLRRSDGRVHTVLTLFEREGAGSPRALLVVGANPALQLGRYRNAMLVSYALSGAILLIMMAVFFRRLERRFVELRTYAAALGEGKLDCRAPALGRDELGELVTALGGLADGLGRSIANVRQAARGVDGLSGRVRDASRRIAGDAGTQSLSLETASRAMSQLAEGSSQVDDALSKLIATAEHSHRDMNEIAGEVRSIGRVADELARAIGDSQRSVEQAERNMRQAESAIRMLTSTAESTATSMSEMAASIAAVEDGTELASQRARESALAAEAGVNVGRETVRAIHGIQENTEATVASVRFLSERVQSIDQILSVIDDVANQTKLLALNASIIAAQAGEHGAGFLVVAEQIKALSAKTAGSTQEIASVIAEVRRRAAQTIQVAESSLGVVREEVGRVTESSETLITIEQLSRELEELIARIDRAMKDQARGAEGVNAAMQDVYGAASTVGGLVQEQLESGRRLRGAMTRVSELLEQTLETANEKAAKVGIATAAMVELYERLGEVRTANEQQLVHRDDVIHSVATLEQLSARNRESAKVLASAVEEAVARIATLAAAVDRIEAGAQPPN